MVTVFNWFSCYCAVQRLYVNKRTNKLRPSTDRAAQIYRALTEAQCIIALWVLKRACIIDRLNVSSICRLCVAECCQEAERIDGNNCIRGEPPGTGRLDR